MTYKFSGLAKFMHEHASMKPDVIFAEAEDRWPAATREHLLQAMIVAIDIMRMDAAVEHAEGEGILAGPQAEGKLP
ncbi:hypothetical protein [uncultured Phenylobacterium sp.]|uniref:hypothetical protein n=1 Tax=uncultured Phenylobacterium sp. TaxID=349273 RepID=UPI0025D3931C|nr:hypothetical protein [uncultured Phenylobacterium sp.]